MLARARRVRRRRNVAAKGDVNDTTSAVYNDDLNAMQAHFDAALQKQVTLDGVSALSQKLHAFGAFKGLTQTAADPSGGRYDYNASFDHATMAVHVRMDGDGRIAAYRIDVPQTRRRSRLAGSARRAARDCGRRLVSRTHVPLSSKSTSSMRWRIR